MQLVRKTRETLTAKERVMRTLARQCADRVPINYFANSAINRKMEDYFGVQQGDGVALKEALGVDFACIWPTYVGPQRHPDLPGRRIWQETGIRTQWIEHSSGGYWDYCDFPLQFATEEEVANWPMATADDYDYQGSVEYCRKHTRFALHLGHPGVGDIINSTGMLRTMEQVLVDLMTDDPAGLLLIERKYQLQLEVARRMLEAARGLIDFMWIGEDLGTQHAPLISLELFRKQIRPRHQKMIDLAKSFNLPVILHSCGSSSWSFHDFIDMGLDAVDTLQPEAHNMSPAYLKRTFGQRLAFHGCISTAGPVAYGTPEEVRQNVRETLDIMMPGGGYCFSPTHSLQDNSPLENVVAMYQAVHDFGWY